MLPFELPPPFWNRFPPPPLLKFDLPMFDRPPKLDPPFILFPFILCEFELELLLLFIIKLLVTPNPAPLPLPNPPEGKAPSRAGGDFGRRASNSI